MEPKKEKIKIVIMTGNGLRHRYFANYLSTQLDVLGIVSETLKPLDLSEGIIKKHFAERNEKEEYYFRKSDFLKNNDKFNIENVLSIPRGQASSSRVFNWISNLKPNFVALYGSSIIEEPILSHFKTINMHLGLSPYYRGSGTNFWPLVDRKPEYVGATIHLATPKVDAGAILAQVRPGIEASDRNHDLGCKTIMAGTKLMVKVLQNPPTPKPQIGKGKLCKSKDFNSKAVLKMWKNLDEGMIKKYLDNKKERDNKYPIC